MVQLNPVPVFGAKKKTSTTRSYLAEIFHRNFRANGKRSRCFHMINEDLKSKRIENELFSVFRALSCNSGNILGQTSL